MMVIERINRSGDIFLEVPEEEDDRSEFLIAVDPGHFIGTPARRTPQMPNVIEDDEGNLQLCWEDLASSLAEGLECPSFDIITPDGRITIVTEDGVVTPSGWNVSARRTNPVFTILGTGEEEERIQMREWEFNNAVVNLLVPLLRDRGYSVLEVAPDHDPRMNGEIPVRDTNGVDNTRRVRRAHNHADDPNDFGREANFYLSIHANASNGATNADGSDVIRFTAPSGIETIHPPTNPGDPRVVTSIEYAVIVQRYLMINGNAYGMPNRGVRPPPGVLPHVLTHTNMPAVVVEGGFFTNFRDAVLLMDNTFRQRTAEHLRDAVDEIYELWREEQGTTE